MGLNMICNDKVKSIGTYQEVYNLKKVLIESSVKYLITMDSDYIDDDDRIVLIDFIKNFILNEEINYSNFSLDLLNKTKLFNLNGIITFIMKNDNNNIMSVGDVVDFLCSLDKILVNIDLKYFNENILKIENFYLYETFIESLNNNKIIEFF